MQYLHRLEHLDDTTIRAADVKRLACTQEVEGMAHGDVVEQGGVQLGSDDIRQSD